MKTQTKSWINIFLLISTLVVNAMGAFGLINNLSQREVSDMYQTLITPAPSTFSIWSVIYTLLIISIIVMAVRVNRDYYSQAVDNISGLFWISCLLNIAWIVSFSFNQIAISVIFIFLFLLVMTQIIRRLGQIQRESQWLLPLTFGLYSGWLFIATVVNISAWLVKINWSGFGLDAEIWSIITLAVSVLLVTLVSLKLKNAIFPLPIAWAYWGIYNSLTSVDGFNGQYSSLEVASLIGLVLLIILAIYQYYRNGYKLMPKESKF